MVEPCIRHVPGTHAVGLSWLVANVAVVWRGNQAGSSGCRSMCACISHCCGMFRCSIRLQNHNIVCGVVADSALGIVENDNVSNCKFQFSILWSLFKTHRFITANNSDQAVVRHRFVAPDHHHHAIIKTPSMDTTRPTPADTLLASAPTDIPTVSSLFDRQVVDDRVIPHNKSPTCVANRCTPTTRMTRACSAFAGCGCATTQMRCLMVPWHRCATMLHCTIMMTAYACTQQVPHVMPSVPLDPLPVIKLPQPPAPQPLDNALSLDASALLQHHRSHWRRVRQHHTASIRAHGARYEQRLAVLLGIAKAPCKQAKVPAATTRQPFVSSTTQAPQPYVFRPFLP